MSKAFDSALRESARSTPRLRVVRVAKMVKMGPTDEELIAIARTVAAARGYPQRLDAAVMVTTPQARARAAQ